MRKHTALIIFDNIIFENKKLILRSATFSTEIFNSLFATIETIGIDKTIKVLQEAALHNKSEKNFDIEFIFSVVSQVTNVSKERILTGSDRTDDRKIATSLCVYFIKEYFSYSLTDMKKIFGKDESALSRFCAIIDARPNKPKTDFDKKIDVYFKKVNLIISEKTIKYS